MTNAVTIESSVEALRDVLQKPWGDETAREIESIIMSGPNPEFLDVSARVVTDIPVGTPGPFRVQSEWNRDVVEDLGPFGLPLNSWGAQLFTWSFGIH